MAAEVDAASVALVPRQRRIPQVGSEVGLGTEEERSGIVGRHAGNWRTIPLQNGLLTPFCHNRADDLIAEESPEVQLALKRLSPKEAYDRVFRMRRAVQVCNSSYGTLCWILIRGQCSIAHQLLPKNEWTKPSEVDMS